MRLLSLSVVVFSGCILASVGTITNALPSARQYNSLTGYGLTLAIVAMGLLIRELFAHHPPSDA